MITETDNVPNSRSISIGDNGIKKVSERPEQNICRPTFVKAVTNYGDIITGDHIAFIKEWGYTHHVIVEHIRQDLNLLDLIEFGGNEGFSCAWTEATIRKITLIDPFQFQVVRYEYGETMAFSYLETIKRAHSRLGERGYNIFTNNCEHFASWCRSGLYTSRQVIMDSNRILRTAFHLTNLANILVLFKRIASQRALSNPYLRILYTIGLILGTESFIAKINFNDLKKGMKAELMEMKLYNRGKTELLAESIGGILGSIAITCLTIALPTVKLFATSFGNLIGRAVGRIVFRWIHRKGYNGCHGMKEN